MNAANILLLLQLLPALAPGVAQAIRELLGSSGYDVDKLLSAGTALNSQTLTHVENEILRVKAQIAVEEAAKPKEIPKSEKKKP